jgi:anti-sigma factor RsiW
MLNRRRHPLRCRDIVGLVTDFTEEALSASDRKRFESHLRGCGACSEYLAQLRTVVRLTGLLAPESIAPETIEELVSEFRRWKMTSP